jgi:hypothetical protein
VFSGRAFREAAGQDCLYQAVVRMIGSVLVQLLAQTPDLLPEFLCIFPFQVDAIISKRRNIGMPDLGGSKRGIPPPVLLVCSSYTITR